MPSGATSDTGLKRFFNKVGVLYDRGVERPSARDGWTSTEETRLISTTDTDFWSIAEFRFQPSLIGCIVKSLRLVCSTCMCVQTGANLFRIMSNPVKQEECCANSTTCCALGYQVGESVRSDGPRKTGFGNLVQACVRVFLFRTCLNMARLCRCGSMEFGELRRVGLWRSSSFSH